MKTLCSARVFTVSNLDKSLDFYKQVLGFSEDFRFGNYAGVKYGEILIHLSQTENPNSKPAGNGVIYIFCDEVDEYYNQILAKGARLQKPPQNYEYGMRDFIAEDLDGNFIGFGTECKK